MSVVQIAEIVPRSSGSFVVALAGVVTGAAVAGGEVTVAAGAMEFVAASPHAVAPRASTVAALVTMSRIIRWFAILGHLRV